MVNKYYKAEKNIPGEVKKNRVVVCKVDRKGLPKNERVRTLVKEGVYSETKFNEKDKKKIRTEQKKQKKTEKKGGKK